MPERRFLFKNTVTDQVFVLPVTPAGYQISHGRKAVQVDMHGVGQLNLPGEKTLLDEKLECFFPARSYPFSQPEAGTDPFVPLETLEKWSDRGDPVRFIVSGTPVNALVLLDPITYGERDGSGDLYVTIPMRGYRILALPTAETETAGNAARAVETEPAHAGSYTVEQGDSLWEIARWVYGDGSLYTRLAAANGIVNPDLIYPGQRLTLPDAEALPPARAAAVAAQIVERTETRLLTAAELAEESSPGAERLGDLKWKVRLSRESGKALVELMEEKGLTRRDAEIRWGS